MATLYRNFLAGTTTDNPLSSGATTINSSGFASLPVVSGSDVMWLVLDPDATAGAPEIVKVTAHTASATSVTVTRAQQSTSARSHASGTTWRAVLTQTDLEEFLKTVDTANIVDGAVTTAKIADVNVTTAKIADLNVTTGKLAADAVNGTKIADDSIDSEHYVDGSIDSVHLADAAVTTAKIADANVTSAKLASQAVRPSNFSPSIFTRAAAQSIPNGGANISWTAEVQDLDGWGTVTTSTLICPATGWYLIAAQADYASNPSSGSTPSIQIDGVTIANAIGVGFSPFIGNNHVTTYITAGQSLTLSAGNTTGSAIDVTARIFVLRLN